MFVDIGENSKEKNQVKEASKGKAQNMGGSVKERSTKNLKTLSPRFQGL